MTARPDGRCLGLIGGLGVAATVHYYRELVAAHDRRARTPRLIMTHADVNQVRAFVSAKDLDGLARYLAGFIRDTAGGGAQFAAIVAVTPHICAAQLTPISALPIIDMIAEVSRDLRARGLRRVALLGTRYTIETRMFGRLDGIEIVQPKPGEIERIDTLYFDFVNGKGSPAKLDELQTLARTFISRDGAEAVLIAGTDLSMELDPRRLDFPAIDCARIHIDAITRQLLG